MPRLLPFLAGILAGVLLVAALMVSGLSALARFMVIDNLPVSADAIVAISGANMAGRLRKGLDLQDQRLASQLILVSGSPWRRYAEEICADCRLLDRAVILEGSVDTRTDAQISLQYCREHNLRKILVLTAPYHTRRTQLVFNDIYAGSGIEATVISIGDYGGYVPPDGAWWRDRKTLETVWLEFGKILYWELTPYMEYQGEEKPGK